MKSAIMTAIRMTRVRRVREMATAAFAGAQDRDFPSDNAD